MRAQSEEDRARLRQAEAVRDRWNFLSYVLPLLAAAGWMMVFGLVLVHVLQKPDAGLPTFVALFGGGMALAPCAVILLTWRLCRWRRRQLLRQLLSEQELEQFLRG